MVATAHLDADILDELQVIMGDDFAGLLNTFVQDSIQRVEAVEREFAARNAVALRAAAHSFKGSSSNLGANQLAQLCRQIEDLALAGNLDACAAPVGALGAEFAAVKQEVDALMAR
jgi:HPt (histidine-containing phosphotransfer) domain-containing protein